MHKTLLLFVLIFFISCSTPQMRIYSINISQYPQESRKVRIDEGVFLQIKTNKHFRQTNIIYKSSIYEMMPSLYAKWDSPPDDILRNQITEALIRKGLFKDVRYLKSPLTKKYFMLDIVIKDFSRIDEGNKSAAVLILDITLRDSNGNNIYKKESEFKEGLEDKTYLNLAKGMSNIMTSALIKITDDIEDALIKYLNQKTS